MRRSILALSLLASTAAAQKIPENLNNLDPLLVCPPTVAYTLDGKSNASVQTKLQKLLDEHDLSLETNFSINDPDNCDFFSTIDIQAVSTNVGAIVYASFLTLKVREVKFNDLFGDEYKAEGVSIYRTGSYGITGDAREFTKFIESKVESLFKDFVLDWRKVKHPYD